MPPRRRPTRALLPVVALVAALAGCSDDASSDGAAPVTNPVVSVGSAPQGARCLDVRGDLSTTAGDLSAALSEPSGVDLVEAEVAFEDGQLVARFEVAGPVAEVDRPSFTVFHGPPGDTLSWEVQAALVDGAWTGRLLTYVSVSDGIKVTDARLQPLDLDVAAEGSSVVVRVANADLPPAPMVLWAFGSASGAEPGRDGEDGIDQAAVLDDCSPFTDGVPGEAEGAGDDEDGAAEPSGPPGTGG